LGFAILILDHGLGSWGVTPRSWPRLSLGVPKPKILPNLVMVKQSVATVMGTQVETSLFCLCIECADFVAFLVNQKFERDVKVHTCNRNIYFVQARHISMMQFESERQNERSIFKGCCFRYGLILFFI
jgi:hypothetical protein